MDFPERRIREDGREWKLSVRDGKMVVRCSPLSRRGPEPILWVLHGLGGAGVARGLAGERARLLATLWAGYLRGSANR